MTPPPSSLPSHTTASSSLRPNTTLPASYHPLPRPKPIPPFEPVDTKAIKQELHDALGENGLPYWKAMNGYILGQVGRKELEGLVRSWLRDDKLHLHNKLLVSLLHNASTPPIPPTIKKRKRVSPDDVEFDIDDTSIEARHRVSYWLSGLTPRDRNRMKRLMGASSASGTGARPTDMEEEEDEEWLKKRMAMSTFTPRNPGTPTITDRYLPSSNQLSQRLAHVASSYGLGLSPDTASEIGEFMAVGTDAHLSDVLHGIVHITGRERPGQDSIHIPHGALYDNDEEGDFSMANGHGALPNSHVSTETLPRPTIDTLQHVFTIRPHLHPQASPALYKLGTSQYQAEMGIRRRRNVDTFDNVLGVGSGAGQSLMPNGNISGGTAGVGSSTSTSTVQPATNGVSTKDENITNGSDINGPGMGMGKPPTPTPQTIPSFSSAISAMSTSAAARLNGPHRREIMSRSLIENGLVKFDKPDEGGKKKHTFHWKYEDPALLLRDILG